MENIEAEKSEDRWKPPYQPWFEGDFSGSFNVRKMKPLERLMYRSLLAQAWHSDRPPYLPNNDTDLSMMADAPTPEDWESHKDVVLSRFKKTDDGQWLYHPKSLREYKRALSEHQRKVEAGVQRWRRSQGETGTTTPPLQMDSTSSPTAEQQHRCGEAITPTSTTTTTSTTTKTIASKREGFDLALEEIWNYYLAKLGKNPHLYRYTDERRRKGKARLEECCRIAAEPKLENAMRMMKLCIDRLAASGFHNGDNRDGKKYLDWDHLFRNNDKLVRWLDDDLYSGREKR